MSEPNLMHHNYDGIQEYDNPMPGWWVWTFAITTIFCAPYIMWYHLGQGPSIHDNYQGELTAYANEVLAKYGELTADEPTIRSFMDNEVAMTGMASVFRSKCAQCHLPDGSGSVGPNLTDTAWINVKSITDIAKVIREGVPAKGMPAWAGKLSETQVALLSSYVAQLQRKSVPGKAAQGTDIGPWPAVTAAPASGTGASS